MPSNKKLLQAAAGNAGEALYVEDVFSTYLYEGTTTSQSITGTGVDVTEEGGLVWIKNRTGVWDNALFDTINTGYLKSNSTAALASNTQVTLEADGFSFSGGGTRWNNSGDDYASWSFRKAEKFFDVVTYTGDGVTGRTVSHNLGSVPGMMVIKNLTDGTKNWEVWHRVDGVTAVALRLNLTSASSAPGAFNNTDPTSTVFTLAGDHVVNKLGDNYVAYLFAHDAGGFGDDEDENIINCGSYTGAGANLNINVGFEPQFVLIKSSSNATNWVMFDTMRGLPVDGNAKDLRPNLSDAEGDNSAIGITSTGFLARNGIDGQINASGRTYIYMAIRRPMKTPESGTEVFDTILRTGTGSNATITGMGFTPDLAITKIRTIDYPQWAARLTNNKFLKSSTTDAEATGDLQSNAWDVQEGLNVVTGGFNSNGDAFANWFFKRATGFFDAVAYSGDGTASRQITHNLGSAPDMIIVKCRSASNTYWETWHEALPDDGAWASNVALNSADGYGGFQRFDGAATQTAAYWTTGNNGEPNTSGQTYISYLFATLAGVSKVGSYTGTGNNVDVDCGFSAGARFILIKRSDSTGDWYVWDSERGIVAGNDPYLLLNSTDAEVTNTDYIDPLNAGFTVTSTAPAALNASGGTYIFLAIA